MDDFSRGIPDTQVLSQFRIERLQERFVEVENGSGRFTTSFWGVVWFYARQLESAEESIGVHTIQCLGRQVQVGAEAEFLNAPRVLKFVVELRKKWDFEVFG